MIYDHMDHLPSRVPGIPISEGEDEEHCWHMGAIIRHEAQDFEYWGCRLVQPHPSIFIEGCGRTRLPVI